jgi:hypothetical protein
LAAAALTVTVAIPVAAAPPEVFEAEVISLFPDLDNERSVFVNITARDFCDWVGDGFFGPPPAQKLIEVREIETGQGALISQFDDSDVYIELWEFDDSVDPNDPTTLIGPCADIQDQLDDPEAAPWAVGTLDKFKGTDNDLFASGTRANAFGDQGRGVVTADGGTDYSYSWHRHVTVTPNGEVATSSLKATLKALK